MDLISSHAASFRRCKSPRNNPIPPLAFDLSVALLTLSLASYVLLVLEAKVVEPLAYEGNSPPPLFLRDKRLNVDRSEIISCGGHYLNGEQRHISSFRLLSACT